MGFTISFKDRPGSPKEAIYPDKFTATRKVRCAYEDRLTLAKEFMGYRDSEGNLHPPHKYIKDDSFFGPAYVISVETEPIIGLDKNTGNYQYADLTVGYTTLSYDREKETETYLTESVTGASEFLTLGNNNLFWDAAHTEPNRLKSDEVPAMLHRMLEWVYTRHHENSIPSAIFDYVGYVNSAAVYSSRLGKSFAAETLLFGNPQCNRTITSDGGNDWEITYTFIYNSKSWNTFPRTNDVTGNIVDWLPIYNQDGDQVKPYPTTSFGSLII